MHTLHAAILGVALAISAGLLGGAYVVANRYTIVTIGGNNVAWKLDRVTGQAYGCEESEFGPFCIPAPNQIKHTQ